MEDMLAHTEPVSLLIAGRGAALALLQAQGHYPYFWAAVALHGLPSSAGSVLCSRDAGTRPLKEHSPTQFKRQPLYRWEA